MIPNFWCDVEVATAELHLCFLIKGKVWWKCTFLPMFTIVVLHHKDMKLVRAFTLEMARASTFAARPARS